MTIKEVRLKYPELKISYLPKKDYLIGITDTKTMKQRKDDYDDVFIAKESRNKYYLLYPSRDWLTGSFLTREKAIEWFRKGGR